MGWGNAYRRRMKVFALALVVYMDYKALQQRGKWIRSKSKEAALWQKAHERNARRVLDLMIELEGLWVKLGQYLSTRADVLPGPYISLLKQLQDSLPPRPLQEVRRTIEQELGKSIEDLFSNFVETPLATASIAQVHRATLKNGEEVVVKVQHEGVKRVIMEDLKNAKSIVEWIAWAEPQYDFNPMIDEWCKEAPKELDFNIEAENTRTVARNLGCSRKNDSRHVTHVDAQVPEVIESAEKVIMLEYMDGIRLNDIESLDAMGVDKQKLVEEITRAYAHQIYVDGFFNGDPHPGNFLVSKIPPHHPILLDFGLTKSLPHNTKQALAKMLLASAEETLPKESMKSFQEKRAKNMKTIKDKMNLNEKEVKRFNPVDAFPGDIVIFSRVLNLLRGLSSSMNLRINYFDIMRPFAESVLEGSIARGPSVNVQWIHDTPLLSDVEAKLRQLLIGFGNANKILGIQVCAYKDGEVIIDTSAGVLGKYDPRPVQPDSLFPVFSVSKGITSGMLHWLIDQGKLDYEENVANIWPEFAGIGKDSIKVHHILNHTSGLQNAMANLMKENPMVLSDWNECLELVAMSSPETEPGSQQLYHYLSFGWLCGGIIERASGKKFQEILEEALIRVEARLATLTLDTDDLSKLSELGNNSNLPSTFQPSQIAETATALPALFNSLFVRRAIIPAANGHCSARALARYYASLLDSGVVPPCHSSKSMPPLGSHTHIPKFKIEQGQIENVKRKKKLTIPSLCKTMMSENFNHKKDSKKKGRSKDYTAVPSDETTDLSTDQQNATRKMFHNPKIHDAFLGVGEYQKLVYPNGDFGLGFKRIKSKDGGIIGFGHSGMGGSTGFCDIENRFAIAITLNKMSFGGVTAKITQLVCSELGIPPPMDLSRLNDGQSDAEFDFERPLIN
ncbi:hypothetical protein V2J09_011317 [Rumex salicifolius]